MDVQLIVLFSEMTFRKHRHCSIVSYWWVQRNFY